jgi:poly(A) polymerase
MTSAEIRKASSALRQALKISNDETAALEGTLSFGHLLTDEPDSVAKLKRFLAHPHSRSARAMMAAMSRFGVLRERIGQVLAALKELARTEFAPNPLITGDDLTAAGIKPGKIFKEALDAAYDAQLEGRVKTKEEALVLALKIVRG